jgi:hypothetical protein
MAGYVHSEARKEALQSSISKLSSDSLHEAQVIDSLKDALAEEFERQESGASTCEPRACLSHTGSEEAPDVVQALEEAQAEALEFERQQSGFDDDRIGQMHDSVVHARSAADIQQQKKERVIVPTTKLSEQCEAVPDAVVGPNVQASPVIEALTDAFAEEVEFQRFVSGNDTEDEPLPCRVTMLEDSIKRESAAHVANHEEQRKAKDMPAPSAPQYLFSQPGVCDSVAAMEEAAADMHEMFVRQASGEDEDQLASLQESVSIMKDTK